MSDAASHALQGVAGFRGGWAGRPLAGLRTVQALPAGLRNAAATALCLLGAAQLLAPGALAGEAVAVLALPLVAVIVTGMNRGSVAPTLICVTGAGALLLVTPAWTPIQDGLAFATILAAFLGAVVVLRQTLGVAGLLDAVMRRYAEVTSAERAGVLLLLSYVLGAVLGLGTFLLVAPLVRHCAAGERAAAAGAALCGTGLSFLWSPLLMGTALVSSMVPTASPLEGLLLALPLSLLALAVALAAYGGLHRTVPAQAARMLRPLLAPLVLILGAVLAIGAGFGLPLSTCVVLAIGGLVALWLLSARRAAIPEVLSGSYAKLGGSLADLPLYIAGLVLARAIAQSGAPESMAALEGLPVPPHLLLPLLVLVGLLLALAGLNAVVCAGVVLALGATLPAGADPQLLLVVALFTWTASSMLGFTSVTLAMAGSAFGVTPRSLLSRRNLGTLLACGTVLTTLCVLETVR
jgi:hypothetical protein